MKSSTRYFKVKHTFRNKEFWLPILASSMGEAIVIADSRNLQTSISICYDPAIEITSEIYSSMING